MTTATSGLDDNPSTPARRRGRRRRQLFGAALAVATAAAATVIAVGGDVDSAEAQFGATPPPATSTLCETLTPDEASADPAMDWANKVNVSIPLMTIDGDSQSPTRGDATSYTGDFTYVIVLDNTGDPFDPDIDNHPSYHPMASSTPVVLTGTGSGDTLSVELPPGCRYIASVRAPGHDLGGAWIRIESFADGSTVDATAAVNMITNESLPLAQVVVRAFHDFAQPNAQFDIGEYGLPDFDIILNDGGERAIDYFGNPLCTEYDVSGGDPTKLDAADLDGDGVPLISLGGGNCLTDADGFLTIKYIPAGWYEIQMIPPDNSDWVQTTTIEGTQVIEAWLLPGDAGLGGEFIGDLGGGTFQAFGFASPTAHPDGNIDYQYPYTPAATGGDVTGCAYNGQIYPSASGVETVVQNGSDNADGSAQPLFDSYVAISDVGVHDSQIDMVATDDSGCFRFDDVPQGTYQLTIWDYELRYIIGFYNVTVAATTVDPGGDDQGLANGEVAMGDLFVLRWFGWSSGYVFYDSGFTADGRPIDYSLLLNKKDGSTHPAANGVRDCLGQGSAGFVYDDAPAADCEAGIPEQEVLVRDRDGSIAKAAITDGNGYYEIDDIWGPMFKMQVIEVGAGALDFTGHSVHDQFDRNAVNTQGNCTATDLANLDGSGPVGESCLPAEFGGGLLLGSVFQQGKRNEIDFGKLSYIDPNSPNGLFGSGDGHGGIAGGVINSVTRAEWAASKQGAEDNEPGVPGVGVTLYQLGGPLGCADADNPDCYYDEVDHVETDAYQHPGIARNGQTCTIPTADGTDFQAVNPTFGPIGDNCTATWLLGAHTKDAAWDGGFAFSGFAPGFYVVEVELPYGYQVVKENDMNTGEGNTFVPAVPPAGCVGVSHYPQVNAEYASPFDAFDDGTPAADDGSIYNGGATSNLCDRKLVRVQPFRNAGVEFQLMTNDGLRPFISNDTGGTPLDSELIPNQAWRSDQTVPMPGRFQGLVLNDLNMTANQNSLTFGEQQGVPGVPVGIYDSAGTLLHTVWTDENGQYEVLVPSTFTINRATPGGVGPRMYLVVVNDPGPLGNNWGYDPSFITNPNTLNITPGKMTKADTPLLSQAAGPCSLPTGTPQLMQVDRVYNDGSDLQISGLNLAGSSVMFTPLTASGELDAGVAVDATASSSVQANVPSPEDAGSVYDIVTVNWTGFLDGLAAGPYQVSFDDGTLLGTSPRNGITYHVLGTGYDLDVWPVPAPADADDPVIQTAVDAAIADVTDVDGDLVIVPPGSYRESVVVHDDVVLQGYGPGGIIGVRTELGPINFVETPYAFLTGSIVSPFGALLDERMFTDWEATVAATGGWDGNQGVEVGPAFQYLLTTGDITSGEHLQLDGFGITSVRARHGSIHVNGNATGLIVSNNGVEANNASKGGAAVNLGVTSVDYYEPTPGTGTFSRVNGRITPTAGGDFTPATARVDNNNDNIVIRDNRLLHNGGVSGAGGMAIFNGADNYKVIENDICGNYSAEYGGGISHFGESDGGRIADNAIQNNAAFDEGGAILLGSEIGFLGDPVGPGTGDVTVDSNQILYNLSGDDGGGIMALHPGGFALTIENNVIANNVATDIGGGIHLFDALNATIVHNTIANNVSANAAVDSGGFVCVGEVRVVSGGTNTCPRAGGLTTQPNSTSPLTGPSVVHSDPTLLNNVFWNNVSGVVFNNGTEGDEPGPVQIFIDDEQFFPIPDLGVYNGTEDLGATFGIEMNPDFSTLTLPYGAGTNNTVGDPQFVADLPINVQSTPAPALGMQGQITMVYPGTTPIEAGDYHLASGGSPAADRGDFLVPAVLVDIDDGGRPVFGAPTDRPDAGSDEVGVAEVFALMYFSTTRNAGSAVSGFSDSNVTAWWPAGLSVGLDVEALGVSAISGNDAADIDALHVLDADTFLMSFLGNNVSVPGVGTVHDEDVVRFDAAAELAVPGTGWTLEIDGSAIGLNGGAADIDALHMLPNGDYLVSFAGTATVPTQGALTIAVPDEDIVRLVRASPLGGPVVAAYFEPYMSGSSIGLDASNAGDIDGIGFLNGGLLFSTKGRIDVDDLQGGTWDNRDEDVLYCGDFVEISGLWSCQNEIGQYFDGNEDGLAGNNDVNAVSGPLG